MKYIAFSLILLFLVVPSVFATDISIPETDYGDYVTKDELSQQNSFNLFEKTASILTDTLRSIIKPTSKKLVTVVAVIILSSLLMNLKGENKTLSSVIDYISILSLSLLAYLNFFASTTMQATCTPSTHAESAIPSRRRKFPLKTGACDKAKSD
jgi:hypothetical protein